MLIRLSLLNRSPQASFCPRLTRLSRLLGTSSLLATAIIATAHAKPAEDPQTGAALPTDEIVVTGGRTDTKTPPTRVLVNAMQPMSVVSDSFIHDSTAPTGNYDTSIKITPSVDSQNSNGVGLSNGSGLTIRGFTDGQFNTTFDGIPWADSTNFSHNTASWFTNRYLNSIAVDRGPGTASTIGQATFGGTVSLFSKEPEQHMSVAPYAGYGSYNTQQFGIELNSGKIAALGDTRLMLNAEHVYSDGYLSNAKAKRTNLFAKAIIPVSAQIQVTLSGMYNSGNQPRLPGATLSEIATLGNRYGLNNNQQSQAYWGYNRTNLHNDVEYVLVRDEISDKATLSNQVYTYSVDRTNRNGTDPNGTLTLAANVAGRIDRSTYRAYGDILRFIRKGGLIDLQIGGWYEHVDHLGTQYAVTYTPSTIENPARTQTRGNLTDSLNSLQGYVQVDVHPIDGLTLSPGVRYAYSQRSIHAAVNRTTRQPLDASVNFGAALPSFSANYKIRPNWSVYGQVAKGFLTPYIDYLYVKNPSESTLSPEQTVNYQAGTAYSAGNLSLAADLYYINFKNLIQSTTLSNGDTAYVNSGGVVYKGIEAEGTWRIGHGVSLYANGSLNSAKTKSDHIWVADAPDATAAGGILYNAHHISAALIDKWVGARFGDVGETQHLASYNQLDVNIGRTWAHGVGKVPAFKLNLQVQNLLNSQKVNAFSALTANNTPLFFTQPGRSVFVTLSFLP